VTGNNLVLHRALTTANQMQTFNPYKNWVNYSTNQNDHS